VALLQDENIKLKIKVNGLEEEASDAAANLQDAITTNDALLKQVKELEHKQQACTCMFESGGEFLSIVNVAYT